MLGRFSYLQNRIDKIPQMWYDIEQATDARKSSQTVAVAFSILIEEVNLFGHNFGSVPLPFSMSIEGGDV